MNSNYDQFDSLPKRLNFADVINDSWNLFVKVLGIGALAVVIHGIASFMVSQVLGKVTGLNYAQNELGENLENVADFNVIALELQSFYMDNLNALITTSLLSSLIMILAFPLAGGFMLVCREADQNGAANLGTLFQGFKPQYWGRLMVLGLVYFVLSKVLLALFVIPGIYIWVAAVIACPFVMFTNASGIQSLQNSIKLVNKSWFNVFQIILVASLIGFAGYLICFVGRVVSYPFVLVTVYMLYKHMVGFENKDISKIGE